MHSCYSYGSTYIPFKLNRLTPRTGPVRAALSSPEKRTRKKKQVKDDDTLLENSLRFSFMEELMNRARNRDSTGVSQVMYDMIAAGLSPGPRSFHGLVVSYALNGNEQAAMDSLRRELGAGLRPIHETFVALVRLFGSKGHSTRGLEILGAMENLNYDIRHAWIILIEELVRNKHLEDANKVFLKGAKGGLRATDELYDLLIEEDCKAGDHSNALEISYEMEAAGRMATTFHFNCLLSVQATCGIPEIAFTTFENMEYGEDYMKPDTETYNWVIQAYTRADSYDRVQDVAELLGMMVEDHKRVQPNVKTHALLVECFTKYCVVREAIRHFRALKNFEGGTKILHMDGNHGDPLSLYLRALCREGRIIDMLEALEAMANDNQQIPPRAMILSRKYRTLVSSWIEPLQEEAELGYEIDYIARYVEEGGLTGERKRWVPRSGKTPLDPDADGFIYSNPMETSFKQRCLEEKKVYHKKLLKKLRYEGIVALGDGASESDYVRVIEWLKKIIKGPEQNALKPKAASKMLVNELKEELEAQGLPIDGTRNVLYQRVQKARRINQSRGRPLWVPPIEVEEEEVDEELEALISRIKLEEGNTEYWKRRFLGEGLNGDNGNAMDEGESESPDVQDYIDVVGDDAKEAEDDEADEDEEEEVEQIEEEIAQVENQDVERIKEKEVESKKPLQMIGVQLLKDFNEPSATFKKSSRRRSRRNMVDDDADDDWFPLDIFEAFKEMRNRRVFDVSDMYTLADAWGWTWEKELKNRPPHRWSQEWEVDLAIKVMQKVIQLGGTPTIGDCAVILRAAISAPLPSAFLTILQTTHGLGYKFGRPLYDEVISLCLDLGELDAAVAVVADLETTGILVSDQTLDRVISAKQGIDNPSNDGMDAGL
ncbi:plastid transcriptionally active protein [Medicago truncatula]|uniref:Plastid transcriptionally active protein n=1 Tax=Medicago truncatula TaxID=3880 RepID=A0A072VNI7_MEDTR|nr:plastid transcriptionally active protein [Medicago truncatula]